MLFFWFFTYYEVEIDIVRSQISETAFDAILHAVMPGVVQLRRQPDLGAWDTRFFDGLADFFLVAVCQSGVDVAVPLGQCPLDGVGDFIGLGLPCSQADGGDLVACVEAEGLSAMKVRFFYVREGCFCLLGYLSGCHIDKCSSYYV